MACICIFIIKLQYKRFTIGKSSHKNLFINLKECVVKIVLVKNISYIANYLWKESIRNINTILSDNEKKKFNVADYYYLTAIYYMGNPNIGEISKALELTKPAISAMIKRLESGELIIKRQSLEDKRVYYLDLTDKGKKIVEGDSTLYSSFTDIIRNLTTEEQMKDVECLLQEIVNIIKTGEAE